MNRCLAHSHRRRGVLLLVVLSMLTLFMLLGTAYLVVSTRSRFTARAFNRLVMMSDEARIPREAYLDRTLMHLVRGGTATSISMAGGSGTVPFESLLEDKYGRNTTLTGTASQVSGSSTASPGPVLTLVNVTLTSATSGTAPAPPFPTAAELPGRVLTFCPDDGAPTSHRILSARATGGTFTLAVDAPASGKPFRLPKPNCHVVVNGREFDGLGTTNEAWDAFDVVNPFLARIEPVAAAISTGTSMRMSYVTSGTDLWDSDNDGQADSHFVDVGLPSIPTSSGTIEFNAAVLVVDLDSRFNVNAHGSLVTTGSSGTAGIYGPNHPGWPKAAFQMSTGTSLDAVPIGSGYGPAEINPTWLFRVASGTTAVASPPNQVKGEDNLRWLMTGGVQSELTGIHPTTAGSRFAAVATPRLQSLQGRYGEVVGAFSSPYILGSANPATLPGDPLPGRAGVDDLVSAITDQRVLPVLASGSWTLSGATCGIPPLWWTGMSAYDWRATRSSFNSPPDLHGRMKTLTAPAKGQGAIVPRLVYAKPEWGDGESKDDPYEILLGPSAPSNGWMSDPNANPGGFMPVFDNPFQIAELEPVLRPYDSDTFRMPMRLSAMLGSLAEEARLRVTTTSWDTTAITGTAAANLGKWIRNVGANFVTGTSATHGTLGGEVARWERFDLNRPLTDLNPGTYSSGTHPYFFQRQAYFKDLYALVCAVLHPNGSPPANKAKEYAQWVANVVEFRDADSTMTPFEYDTNPFNGWNVNGDASSAAGDADRDLVWGAERPEILIMQTSAWEDDKTGELYIVLHRPWNADAISASGTVAGEPVDPALDVPGVPKNVVDLGRKSGTASPTDQAAFPVWRLRIDDNAGNRAFVRLDVAGSGTSSDFSSSAITSPASTPKMAADSWLCVLGGTTVGMTITTTGTVNIDRSGAFRVPGDLPKGPSLDPRKAMVYLERLTDPSATGVTAAVWASNSGTSVPHYHVVDQAPVQVINRIPATAGAPPAFPETMARNAANPGTAIWKCDFPLEPTPSTSLGTSAFANARAMWLPWPNRPFVSAAELALVPGVTGTSPADFAPGQNAYAVLKNYEAAMPNKNRFREMHLGASLNHLALLDAVHVPTRFAGIHRTVTSDPTNALDQKAGIYYVTTPVNQLSSYREPGRVNLNTITADDVWCAAVAGSLSGTTNNAPSQPAPLKSRVSPQGGQARPEDAANFVNDPAAAVVGPGASGGGPAQSMSALLAMQGSASLDLAADTHPTLTAAGTLNPAHLLYTANRLANTATIRSNVFAVWITIRERNPDDPDSVKYHRAFYIVDRSIPVAHEPGKDHNVWDAVLLRRIIE